MFTTESLKQLHVRKHVGALGDLLRFAHAVILIAVIAILFGPVLSSLATDWWEHPDYSHGFFVPLLAVYLIWQKRSELRKLPINPSWSGLGVVLFSIGLLFLGSLGAELFLTRVSVIGTLAGLIVYFLGWKFLRALAFPVAFLILAIPLPALVYNEIVFPLQLLASHIAIVILDLVNLFPVVRDGNILILPHSQLEVVEACSGIRSLMSLITLALGYGYLVERTQWVRFMLALVMIPVAVLSNAVRVVATTLATYYLGADVAEGFFHPFSGILIFVVATTFLLILHGLTKMVRPRLSGEAIS